MITVGRTPDWIEPTAAEPVGRYTLKSSYADAVARAGGLPTVLPYTDEPDILEAHLARIDALVVTGKVVADKLEVGHDCEIAIEVKRKEGWWASDSGIPKPMLQIDVPKCVKLSGEVLKGFRALSRNEFLQEPYERLIDMEVRFVRQHQDDTRIPNQVVLQRMPLGPVR